MVEPTKDAAVTGAATGANQAAPPDLLTQAGELAHTASDMFWDAVEQVEENLTMVETFADLHEAFYEVEQTTLDEGTVTPPADDYEFLDIGDLDFDFFKKLWSPNRLLLRDKLAFVLGSTELWFCAYWLGASPSTFYKFYTVEALVLYAFRFFYFYSKKWHYYLLDFCYYANVLLLLHIYAFPGSLVLNKVLFAYCTGPLAWSILAFRNSLVYHDLDKVTSLFAHFVPTCVAWTLRWHASPDRFAFASSLSRPGQPVTDPAGSAGVVDLVLIPILPYLAWAVIYYLKIFVISAKKIQARNYATLYKYVTSGKRGMYDRIARSIPSRYHPLAFLLGHLAFTLVSMLMSVVMWHHYTLHTTFLIAMGSIAIWHGANFYFEVFASRYLRTLGLPSRPASGQVTPRRKEE